MTKVKYLMPILIALLTIGAEAQTTDAASKVSNLQWTSDFRYRYDYYDYENDTPPAVKGEQKLRARVGVTGNVVEANKFEIRLATGTGRTSTNQTLGNSQATGTNTQSFSNYDVRIDRASFGLNVAENTFVNFGRMANPFWLVGGSDLVWDSDLNFDGVSLKYASSGDYAFVASLSRFVAATKTATQNAVFLNTAQLGYKGKFAEDHSYLVTASFYHYEDIKGHVGLNAGSGSNNPVTGGNYLDNYHVADLGLEYTFKIGGKNFSLFGHVITNTAASENRVGYLSGFRYNKLKAKGDWTIGYDFRKLEKTSTVGAYTDGESFGGGVNGDNHRVNLGYQAGEAWTVSLTGMSGNENIASGETKQKRERVLADIVLAF